MANLECFAFFCDDIRAEAGGKTSYMGILGPHILLERPNDAPEGATLVLSKLVAVAMIRSQGRESIPFVAELVVEGGPPELAQRQRSQHVLEVSDDFDDYLTQFHAQMPNVPAFPGMKITVHFQAGDQKFGASLAIHEAMPSKRRTEGAPQRAAKSKAAPPRVTR